VIVQLGVENQLGQRLFQLIETPVLGKQLPPIAPWSMVRASTDSLIL
jgi:hypothetical protein